LLSNESPNDGAESREDLRCSGIHVENCRSQATGAHRAGEHAIAYSSLFGNPELEIGLPHGDSRDLSARPEKRHPIGRRAGRNKSITYNDRLETGGTFRWRVGITPHDTVTCRQIRGIVICVETEDDLDCRNLGIAAQGAIGLYFEEQRMAARLNSTSHLLLQVGSGNCRYFPSQEPEPIVHASIAVVWTLSAKIGRAAARSVDAVQVETLIIITETELGYHEEAGLQCPSR
jgi:hypothetical protein